MRRADRLEHTARDGFSAPLFREKSKVYNRDTACAVYPKEFVEIDDLKY